MLQTLTLSHFRHVTGQRFGGQRLGRHAGDDAPLAQINLLLGQNGAGKTNILEAISLLSPGKGLRNASPAIWRQHDAGPQDGWAVNGVLQDDLAGLPVATGSPSGDPLSARRVVMIDRELQTTQQTLAEALAVVWLTPQMDGLFLADTAERRRFFDRLIYALYPDHAKHLAIYDNGLRQRNRLLKNQQRDLFWYRALHQTMSGPATAIAAARNDFVAQLNDWTARTDLQLPLPILSIHGVAEELLHTTRAAQVEQTLREMWDRDVTDDLAQGATKTGPHRSDFSAIYQDKNIDARLCSTGEQKALLVGIILSHAVWVKEHDPARPLIILLDDIAAHFDERRRDFLYDYLPTLPAQIWLSGTDENDFTGLLSHDGVRVLTP